jgi:hypothetical protein
MLPRANAYKIPSFQTKRGPLPPRGFSGENVPFFSLLCALCVSALGLFLSLPWYCQCFLAKRKALCSEVQKILAEDLLYLPLWFNNAVSVHRRSLGEPDLPSTENYNFLAMLPAHR